MTPSEKQTLVRNLLTYLLNNPDAGDTIEGIVRLWILRQRLDLMMHDVESVLEEFVQKGILRAESLPAAEGEIPQRYYHVPLERREEIVALIEQLNQEHKKEQI